MNNLFDFEKNLSIYTERRYAELEKQNPNMTADELETLVDEVYIDWTNTVIDELGESPAQYFHKFGDEELVNIFMECAESESVPSIVTDELSERKNLDTRLFELLKGTNDEIIRTYIVDVLSDMGSTKAFETYLEWIFDESTDDEFATFVYEKMIDEISNYADRIYKELPSASDKIRDRIADMIVECKPRQEGFELLCERLHTGRDLGLYAIYLGKYGDARAIDLLKMRAFDCGYFDFLEIRNAVESLGGEFEIVRDFSDDAEYKAYHRK